MEQREKLGLTSTPNKEPLRSREPLPESVDAMLKVEYEKEKQDDGLSELSNILGEPKEMAVDMGSEIERQDKGLNPLQDDVDEINFRYLKAVARGLLGLPVGAVINALGAIALGAPVGTQYFPRTLYWSLLMSAFTIVPAASVYGSSWVDWQQTFVHTKPIGFIDYMICLSAHGEVIGAWFGAWPMPLDWERTWQEWPICVTYGAIFGYLAGITKSVSLIYKHIL